MGALWGQPRSAAADRAAAQSRPVRKPRPRSSYFFFSDFSVFGVAAAALLTVMCVAVMAPFASV